MLPALISFQVFMWGSCWRAVLKRRLYFFAKEQNWIILNFKTGHGLFNETQNFAIAKQKIRNDLHVNSLFIVSLFVYLAHILFKLILKRGNISNKCHIELQCLLEGSAYFNVDTQWYGTFETHQLKKFYFSPVKIKYRNPFQSKVYNA